ncbi:hypothetical protein ACFE04_017074 [Oxalis oulophora]
MSNFTHLNTLRARTFKVSLADDIMFSHTQTIHNGTLKVSLAANASTIIDLWQSFLASPTSKITALRDSTIQPGSGDVGSSFRGSRRTPWDYGMSPHLSDIRCNSEPESISTPPSLLYNVCNGWSPDCGSTETFKTFSSAQVLDAPEC